MGMGHRGKRMEAERQAIHFCTILGVEDQEMMVAQTKVVGMNMVKITLSSRQILVVEPMVSNGQHTEFEERNSTKYRQENRSIGSI